MIAFALSITKSWVESCLDSLAAVLGWSSMYNLVMFLSRGMHKIVPSVSELMTSLLHRSGKSVSITPVLNQDEPNKLP